MFTYHGFNIVYINTGEFYSVDIEVDVEMTGFVFLDHLEKVSFCRRGFCEDFIKKCFFAGDDVLAGDIVGVYSFGSLALFHRLAQCVKGLDTMHLWIHLCYIYKPVPVGAVVRASLGAVPVGAVPEGAAGPVGPHVY